MRQHELESKALRIYYRLVSAYGEPPRRQRLDPLSELVLTVLSQHTSDVNSGRAFDHLRARFATWEAVRDAPTAAVADAIKSGGLANVKAPRIQAMLRQVPARDGSLNLDFLYQWDVERAREWLLHLNGVGPKTAACVLLFSLGMPALPVDTHVHRVAQRLGLIPPRASAGEAEPILEGLVPVELYYPVHITLIVHGRRICLAGRPRCEICPVQGECDYYQALLAADVRLPAESSEG